MSIDELTRKVHEGWTRREAANCWVTFSAKYNEKYGGALHHVIINGKLDEYIEREANVFKRYATMWGYRNNIPPQCERND